MDLESFRERELIGTGAARAWLRWPGLKRDTLLAEIGSSDVPPFGNYADFLELRYLARWSVRSLLQRKLRSLDPARFEVLGDRPA